MADGGPPSLQLNTYPGRLRVLKLQAKVVALNEIEPLENLRQEGLTICLVLEIEEERERERELELFF